MEMNRRNFVVLPGAAMAGSRFGARCRINGVQHAKKEILDEALRGDS